MDELDEDESSPMGGSMENDKMEGYVRISTWNPNGINKNQVHSILQQSLDLSINIQGYSEVNRDFLKQSQRQAFQEATTRMDRHPRNNLTQLIGCSCTAVNPSFCTTSIIALSLVLSFLHIYVLSNVNLPLIFVRYSCNKGITFFCKYVIGSAGFSSNGNDTPA
jgi:hypothetical protein